MIINTVTDGEVLYLICRDNSATNYRLMWPCGSIAIDKDTRKALINGDTTPTDIRQSYGY